MAARGRQSAAAAATKAEPLTGRPPPPSHLTEAQSTEWVAIVDRMPADWFTRETHALLTQYVRHVENAAKLAKAVDLYDVALLVTEAGAKTFDKLAKMAEREGRAMSSLATRMRLTHQTRYKAETAATATKNAGTAAKPWEFDGDK
jgi:hypothetical protein